MTVLCNSGCVKITFEIPNFESFSYTASVVRTKNTNDEKGINFFSPLIKACEGCIVHHNRPCSPLHFGFIEVLRCRNTALQKNQKKTVRENAQNNHGRLASLAYENYLTGMLERQ